MKTRMGYGIVAGMFLLLVIGTLMTACSAKDTQRTLEGLATSQAEVAAARQRAEDLQQQARQTRTDGEAELARAREAEAAARAAGDAPAEAAARAQAAAAEKTVAKAQSDEKAAGKVVEGATKVAAQINQAVAALESAKGPDGSITPEGAIAAGMTAAAPAFPGVGVILAALAPTVLSVGGMIRAMIQARAANNAAQSIVKSVEVIRLAEPTVADGMAKNKKLARAVLTPEAAKIVDSNRTS